MYIIDQIVGRCSVGESNPSVIRYVISRLRHGYTTFQKMSKSERKALLREIVEAHESNRQLYSDVMSGRIR